MRPLYNNVRWYRVIVREPNAYICVVLLAFNRAEFRCVPLPDDLYGIEVKGEHMGHVENHAAIIEGAIQEV